MAALRYMSGRELANRRTQRTEQLEWIQEQVACGELVIRQATVEECERYGIAATGGDGRAAASAGKS